jgi:hypothetical protein
MIRKIKEQCNDLNYVHVLLSIVGTGLLILGVFAGVGWTQIKSKGDERWVQVAHYQEGISPSQVVEIVTSSISRQMDRHERDAKYHPNDLVTRREFEMVVRNMENMKKEILTAINNKWNNQ